MDISYRRVGDIVSAKVILESGPALWCVLAVAMIILSGIVLSVLQVYGALQ